MGMCQNVIIHYSTVHGSGMIHVVHGGVTLHCQNVIIHVVHGNVMIHVVHGGVTIVHLVHGNVTKDKTCTVAILHFCCCW